MSSDASARPSVAIIGAGPAGLIAAERLAEGGAAVTVFDRMPSPGRKLLMAGRGFGRLIAIGSIQQVREHPEMLVYAASKAALESMVRNIARQVAGQGVTCNVLAPGAIATARNREALADAAYRNALLARIPAGRLGTPEDCAEVALFLTSNAARYVTGTTLFVDGGMHL